MYTNIKLFKESLYDATVVAKDYEHLKMLVEKNIEAFGPNCNLNYIDVSNITNMRGVFKDSNFTGDISQWDTSKVLSMASMFQNSVFNGDISQWNTSNVKLMNSMFDGSKFNQDISNWDTSNVQNMVFMFRHSKFDRNINDWDTSNVIVDGMFGMFYKSQLQNNKPKWYN